MQKFKTADNAADAAKFAEELGWYPGAYARLLAQRTSVVCSHRLAVDHVVPPSLTRLPLSLTPPILPEP